MYQTGTHGSVGGRLANQSSASYPIFTVRSDALSLPKQDKKEKSMREGVTNNGFGRFLKKVVL